MLELPHILVGAAIATTFPSPLVALPLSLASHLATDYLPHWNPHINREISQAGRISRTSLAIIILDSAAALTTTLWLTLRLLPDSQASLTLLFSCILSTLPDLVEFPHYFLARRFRLIDKLVAFQSRRQWNVSPLPGLLSQLIVALVSLKVTLSL